MANLDQKISPSESTNNRSPAELYRFWRNLENLPRIMHHLESVTVMDNNRSHWMAKGPLGKSIEWDAQIVNDDPNERIGWESLPDAEVRNAGSVQFQSAGGDSTRLRVVLRYDPPAGKLGAAVSKLLGESPEHELEEDLKRFKQAMESGQYATHESMTRRKAA